MLSLPLHMIELSWDVCTQWVVKMLMFLRCWDWPLRLSYIIMCCICLWLVLLSFFFSLFLSFFFLVVYYCLHISPLHDHQANTVSFFAILCRFLIRRLARKERRIRERSQQRLPVRRLLKMDLTDHVPVLQTGGSEKGEKLWNWSEHS